MKISEDDIEWLRQLLLDPASEIPAFDLSRLLIFSLVAPTGDGSFRITNEGQQAIAEHHRTKL